MDRIEPTFLYEVPGYQFVNRGCGDAGWSTSSQVAYRCAKCGDLMPADHKQCFNCTCDSMYLDYDYGRFGSRLGDDNILVYRKLHSRGA
jgi:hypothetical protein